DVGSPTRLDGKMLADDVLAIVSGLVVAVVTVLELGSVDCKAESSSSSSSSIISSTISRELIPRFFSRLPAIEDIPLDSESRLGNSIRSSFSSQLG
ncbi:16025_t:CDS:1, partial [Entrophospora sp. SA101]